jgi:hypothetical protein
VSWITPVIPVLGSLSQEDWGFKVSLGYIARTCLKKTNQKKKLLNTLFCKWAGKWTTGFTLRTETYHLCQHFIIRESKTNVYLFSANNRFLSSSSEYEGNELNWKIRRFIHMIELILLQTLANGSYSRTKIFFKNLHRWGWKLCSGVLTGIRPLANRPGLYSEGENSYPGEIKPWACVMGRCVGNIHCPQGTGLPGLRKLTWKLVSGYRVSAEEDFHGQESSVLLDPVCAAGRAVVTPVPLVVEQLPDCQTDKFERKLRSKKRQATVALAAL